MSRETPVIFTSSMLRFVEPYYSRAVYILRQPKTHRFMLKTLVFAALFAALFVVAIMLYASLYLLYVPARGSRVDLYFRYSSNTPTAHVLLSTHKPLIRNISQKLSTSLAASLLSSTVASSGVFGGLTGGLFVSHQPYNLHLQLRAPSSSANINAANFMTSITLYSASHEPLYYATRPTSLKYRSPLLTYMSTLLYAVPLLTGYMSEAQTLTVPLIEGVTSPPAINTQSYQAMLAQWSYYTSIDNSISPSIPRSSEQIDASLSKDIAYGVISLSSSIQTYEATLFITAEFYGLRYVMYHWFFTSAAVGVGMFMVWEVVLGLALWRIFIGRRISFLRLSPHIIQAVDDDDNSNNNDHDEGDVSGTTDASEPDEDEDPDMHRKVTDVKIQTGDTSVFRYEYTGSKKHPHNNSARYDSHVRRDVGEQSDAYATGVQISGRASTASSIATYPRQRQPFSFTSPFNTPISTFGDTSSTSSASTSTRRPNSLSTNMTGVNSVATGESSSSGDESIVKV